MKYLVDVFPNLAKEWDYSKNGKLSPQNVGIGSHKTVYWICPRCHQSYPMRVANRTAPSKQKSTDKCPVCQGKRIIPGYNSLKALYPEIVNSEWDYLANTVDPDAIAPHANKSYYWVCPNGHHYKSSLNNKTSGNGGNCPYCSHQKLIPEFSLAVINPELAEEWDYEVNQGLTPSDVFANSNKSFGWICKRCGHRWRAVLSNRNNNKGCPNCAKGHHSSFPEQVVYHYIKKAFPDSINGFKIEKMEIDVFIPSIKVGIEYDGENYHCDKRKVRNDIRKSQLLKEHGIHLVRLRESGCATLDETLCEIKTFRYTTDYRFLEPLLQVTIEGLCTQQGKECQIIVDVNSIRNQILSIVHTIPYEKSFAAFCANKAKKGEVLKAIWDDRKNYPLTPEMVMPYSEKTVHWICPNNRLHFWENTVKSVSLGYGCKKCSKTYQRTTEEWIEKAQEVHEKKYDYSKTIFIKSSEPVIIICKKHGEFSQKASEHLSGKGCKYCSHQAFHPKESLAIISPEVAAQWDFERNNDSGFTPDNIGIDTKRLFWWHCTNGKSHSFEATIAKRVNGHMQCAVCHGKQFSYDRSLEYLHPELAEEWSQENSLKPSEITCGKDEKVLWNCPNPTHPPYSASIYSRVHLKSGCPICARERNTKVKK